MTNEDRQELARQLKNSIDDLTSYLKIIPLPVDSEDIKWRINIESLALSALTAQPVKLPRRRSMLTRDDIDQDYVTCMAISVEDAVAAIREAGYEVIE